MNRNMDYHDHSFFSDNFSKNFISILLGLSIGRPNTLAHTPFDIHPRARDTANTTV